MKNHKYYCALARHVGCTLVNRILEHWKSLELYLIKAALRDDVHTAGAIFNALKNPVYKLNLEF